MESSIGARKAEPSVSISICSFCTARAARTMRCLDSTQQAAARDGSVPNGTVARGLAAAAAAAAIPAASPPIAAASVPLLLFPALPSPLLPLARAALLPLPLLLAAAWRRISSATEGPPRAAFTTASASPTAWKARAAPVRLHLSARAETVLTAWVICVRAMCSTVLALL